MEKPILDVDAKNYQGIENVHLTTLVLNGRMADELVKTIIQLKNAEFDKQTTEG